MLPDLFLEVTCDVHNSRLSVKVPHLLWVVYYKQQTWRSNYASSSCLQNWLKTVALVAHERLSFTRGLKLSNLPFGVLDRQWALIDGPKCGSIPISTILQKSVRFFMINVRKTVYPRSTLGSHMKFTYSSCTPCSSIEPASEFAQSLTPKELLTQVHLWKFFELLLQACSSFQHMFVLSLPWEIIKYNWNSHFI